MSAQDNAISARDFTHDASDRPAATFPAYSLAVERVAPEQWDATVSSFDDISVEQTLTYASRRWPSLRHEPRLFYRGREVVGGALMMTQRLPLGLASVAIGKWGPMVKDARAPDRDAIYRGMVEAVVREYAVGRGMMLTLLPRVQPESGRGDFGHLIQRGFRQGRNVDFPDRYLVDLRLPDPAHRGKLHSKWRYHLTKSEKQKLTFEPAGADRFPQFAKLYEAMTGRKKFPDHSAYETVPALLSMDAAALRPSLFFVRQGDDIVAGAVIFAAGETAVYLYGATSDAALPLRAGYFLHWNIIQWLKRYTRARWYDLGGNDGFSGLHQFKRGMVGDAGVIAPLPPMANFAARPLPRLIGTSAYAARGVMLNIRQTIAGRFSAGAKPDLPRGSDHASGA